MRFIVTAADHLTGTYACWEVDCESIQQAHQKALAAGYRAAEIKASREPAEIRRSADLPPGGISVSRALGGSGGAVLDSAEDSGVFSSAVHSPSNRFRQPISPASMKLRERSQPGSFAPRMPQRRRGFPPIAFAFAAAVVVMLGCGVFAYAWFAGQTANVPRLMATDASVASTRSLSATAPAAANGGNGILQMPDRSDITLAATAEDYDRIAQLSASHNSAGINEMVWSGHAIRVSSGTSCIIIDQGLLVSEVRIKGGPCNGQSGLVASDALEH